MKCRVQKVESLHRGRFLHCVTAQYIHSRFLKFAKVLILTSNMFHELKQREKKKGLLHIAKALPYIPLFHSRTVSHPSLFKALKRSVMEHVKKGVFIGQL